MQMPSLVPIHTMPFRSSVKQMMLVHDTAWPSWSGSLVKDTCWGCSESSPLEFQITMGLSKLPSENSLMS